MQICIQNLTCKNIIGILPTERETLQRVIINAKITYPYDGENFIDYAALCNFIENDLKEEKYFLLEEAIQSLIQNDFITIYFSYFNFFIEQQEMSKKHVRQYLVVFNLIRKETINSIYSSYNDSTGRQLFHRALIKTATL